MKKIIFAFALGLLFSCSSKGNKVDSADSENVVQGEEATKENQDETNVEILFDEKTFSDSKMIDLLKELNICDPNQKDLNNASRPACDPKFFHILPFIENVPAENAFLLVIRAGVHDWPLRRLLIYEREQGKLVLVNTFVAHLIGKKKSPTKHDDLILQFFDEDENRFQCLFQWKDKKYEYVAVERINGNKMKAEFQDSMNIEIEKVINQNKMVS